jgi:hypothetical protein
VKNKEIYISKIEFSECNRRIIFVITFKDKYYPFEDRLLSVPFEYFENFTLKQISEMSMEKLSSILKKIKINKL